LSLYMSDTHYVIVHRVIDTVLLSPYIFLEKKTSSERNVLIVFPRRNQLHIPKWKYGFGWEDLETYIRSLTIALNHRFLIWGYEFPCSLRASPAGVLKQALTPFLGGEPRFPISSGAPMEAPILGRLRKLGSILRFPVTAAATLPSPHSRCHPRLGEEVAATVAVRAWEKRPPPPSPSAPWRRGHCHRRHPRLGEEVTATIAVRAWEKRPMPPSSSMPGRRGRYCPRRPRLGEEHQRTDLLLWTLKNSLKCYECYVL
jgi:hypothetical protein